MLFVDTFLTHLFLSPQFEGNYLEKNLKYLKNYLLSLFKKAIMGFENQFLFREDAYLKF